MGGENKLLGSIPAVDPELTGLLEKTKSYKPAEGYVLVPPKLGVAVKTSHYEAMDATAVLFVARLVVDGEERTYEQRFNISDTGWLSQEALLDHLWKAAKTEILKYYSTTTPSTTQPTTTPTK